MCTLIPTSFPVLRTVRDKSWGQKDWECSRATSSSLPFSALIPQEHTSISAAVQQKKAGFEQPPAEQPPLPTRPPKRVPPTPVSRPPPEPETQQVHRYISAVASDLKAICVCVFANPCTRAYVHVHASCMCVHTRVRCESSTYALPKLMLITLTRSAWLFLLHCSYYM